jgi:hypothetical protein
MILSSDQTDLKLRLSRTLNNIQIEVWLRSEDEFREGYALLRRLCERAEFEELRLDLDRFRVRDDEGHRIAEQVTEGTHRVALSLLDSWPDSKRVTDISTETGLTPGSVSNILAGRQGGVGSWFEKERDLWKLSPIGARAIVEEVVPALFEQQRSGEGTQ